MERKQFLKTLGASAAFALAFPCLHGCSNDSEEDEEAEGNTPIPTGIDFTLDLSDPENAKLADKACNVCCHVCVEELTNMRRMIPLRDSSTEISTGVPTATVYKDCIH